MKFDGIILDVDGTIWNTTSVVAQAWNSAIEENFPQVKRVTAKILQGQFGKTMKVIADNLFTNLNSEQKNLLMKKCCQKEQIYLKNNKENITYANVVETIEELSKKIPVFIVSNCQAGYIEVVMEKNNITNFITDFECYGNNKKNKAENIQLLMSRNNLKNAVYVGDTQGDADSCKEAGVPFIWVSYGFGKVDEFFAKIDNFSELKKFVEE